MLGSWITVETANDFRAEEHHFFHAQHFSGYRPQDSITNGNEAIVTGPVMARRKFPTMSLKNLVDVILQAAIAQAILIARHGTRDEPVGRNERSRFVIRGRGKSNGSLKRRVIQSINSLGRLRACILSSTQPCMLVNRLYGGITHFATLYFVVMHFIRTIF